MMSKATDHKATVLMNRRMKTERRVTTFGPVCSNVAGMALHHLEGMRAMQEGSIILSRRRQACSASSPCEGEMIEVRSSVPEFQPGHCDPSPSALPKKGEVTQPSCCLSQMCRAVSRCYL